MVNGSLVAIFAACVLAGSSIVATAQELEKMETDAPTSQLGASESSQGTQVIYLFDKNWRDASVWERISEEAASHLYREDYHSLFSLYGYSVEYLEEICRNKTPLGRGVKEDISVGMIAAIHDDADSKSRTRII